MKIKFILQIKAKVFPPTNERLKFVLSFSWNVSIEILPLISNLERERERGGVKERGINFIISTSKIKALLFAIFYFLICAPVNLCFRIEAEQEKVKGWENKMKGKEEEEGTRRSGGGCIYTTMGINLVNLAQPHVKEGIKVHQGAHSARWIRSFLLRIVLKRLMNKK